jgi:type I restriction enzyme, S subunit
MTDKVIQSFDIWTDAQGLKSKGRVKSVDNISLEGIARLRELILELAVRGKLVPQDPNDEPAKLLLKKIEKEKERLVKQKIIGKQVILSEIAEDEKDFEIPSNWEWTRFGNITYQITDGTHHTPIYISEGVPFISVKDVSSGFIDFTQTRFISHNQHEELTKRCNPEKGDLLLTKVGTTGIPVLVETDIPFSLFVSIALIKFAKENISGKYLSLLIKSPLVKKQSEEGTEGIGNKNLVLRKIVTFKIVVPPLAEQHRIVAKVDELMALCDKLETQQFNNLKTHEALVKTLLETLTQATNADELQTAWARLSTHFDTLFCTENSIDQLKQTILQLAVMGKLVKQNPNDEPASELLKKIAKEKEKLVKEGKIRKQAPLSEIKKDEYPFELPDGWEISRLGTFTIVGTGSTPSRDKIDYYFPAEINWVTSGETSQDFIYETEEKISTLALKETNVSVYPKGSLVIAMYGQGKTRGQVSELMIDAGTNQACAVVVFVNIEESHRKYLKYFFKKAYEEMRSHAAGGAQPNLNVGKVSNTIVPIPPISEQNRIVSKVDELFSLCDTLKEKLIQSQEIKGLLAKAFVEGALT